VSLRTVRCVVILSIIAGSAGCARAAQLRLEKEQAEGAVF